MSVPPARDRDPALDLIRSVALVRVVLWHTFAATWMTYFAAIPLLFFVAGALLEGSRRERRPAAVVVRRTRRMLVPLWLYGATVAALGWFATGGGAPELAADGVAGVASWVVPLVDPADAGWHGGWLSNHLWYLRAYLWVLLLAPVLALAARRLRLSLPCVALGVALLEVAAWQELPVAGTGAAHVILGDLLVYGGFVMLGMAWATRAAPVPARRLLLGSVVAAAATAAWVVWVGLPPGGVNSSYPAVVFSGAACLLAFGAAEALIRRMASPAPVRRLTRAVTRRAVTIYLWHPAAILVAAAVVDRWWPEGRFPIALPLVAVIGLVTLLAARGAGWVEELAGGRRRLRTPAVSFRAAGTVAAAVAVMGAAVSLPVSSEAEAAGRAGPGARALPPPSYREALKQSAFARPAPADPAGGTVDPSRLTAARLQRVLDEWMATQDGVASVAAAVAVGSKVWAGESHRDKAEVATRAADRYGIVSVTKTFTVGLALEQIAAGKIGLDDPLPALASLRGDDAGTVVTARQLLQHTSGLVDYHAAPGYDADRPLSASRAVRLALRAPRQATPGAAVHYANVNYLYLGLFLEQATGRPYGDLVREASRRAGLRHTSLERPGRPGWPGFASGGVSSTVADLARWGEVLFVPGRWVPGRYTELLTALGDHNLSLGLWPLCPCGTDRGGVKRARAMGQYSGHGGLYRYADGFTLAVHLEPPVELPDIGRTASLGEAVRRALR